MSGRTVLHEALASCLPRLRLYWKPLTFLCLPLCFGVGALGVQTAEGPVKPFSVLIGGVALGFVAGLAATAERFEWWAAGAPFAVLGMFVGAAWALSGLSVALLGNVAAFLLASAAGLLCGLAARRE
jgi:hypothetical protein